MDNKEESVNKILKTYLAKHLTKREYFAGLAMQGYTAGDMNCELTSDKKAAWSIEDADALLKALDSEV